MTIFQLILAVIFFIIGIALCYGIFFKIGNEKLHRGFTLALLTLSTVLIVISMMLTSASKTEIAIGQIQSDYAASSTIELLGDIRGESHTVDVEANHIYIDKGSEQEKCYVLVKEPFFSIIKKEKLKDFASDLANLD